MRRTPYIRSMIRIAALAAAAAAADVHATPTPVVGRLTAHGGNVPEGLWVLNQARSIELMPGRQTLWIVKDDGRNMVWVSVATDDEGRVRVSSFDSAYGGPPAPVAGSPMTSQAVSYAPGTLHNFGQIAGLGAYVEDCAVDPSQKHFTCDGQVTTATGIRRWHDDFDWAGPTPQ